MIDDGDALSLRQCGRSEFDGRRVVEVVGVDPTTREQVSNLCVHRGQVIVQAQRGPGPRRVPATTTLLRIRHVERVAEVRLGETQPDVPFKQARLDQGATRDTSNVSVNSSRSDSNWPASATSSRVLPSSESTLRRTTAGMRSRLIHLSRRSVDWSRSATLIAPDRRWAVAQPLRHGLPADAEHHTELGRRDVRRAPGSPTLLRGLPRVLVGVGR